MNTEPLRSLLKPSTRSSGIKEPANERPHQPSETLHGFGGSPLTSALNRGSTQTAAIDHPGPAPTDHIDPFGPPPPSSDVAARVAWQIAKRQTQRNATQRQTPSLDLAAGR